MNKTNTNTAITILKQVIEEYKKKRRDMIKGTLTKKTIKGKEYYYLVYREKRMVKTRYIKASELDSIKQAISERKQIEEKQRTAKNQLMQLLKNCPRQKILSPATAESKPMDFMEAIQKNKTRFQQAVVGKRPKREYRSGIRRNPPEAKALARAVYVAVIRASESGYITRTKEGQEIIWKVVTS